MPAAKKNKYAQKWDKNIALELIALVEKHLKKKGSYHIGKACMEALEKLRKKHPNIGFKGAQLWSYLSDKFKKEEEVFEAIKKAELIAEGNIVEDALKGSLKSAAMAIFYLKNKHGYSDKTDMSLQGGDRPIRVITDKEGEALLERLLADNHKEA